jgi:hypothetical protein
VLVLGEVGVARQADDWAVRRRFRLERLRERLGLELDSDAALRILLYARARRVRRADDARLERIGLDEEGRAVRRGIETQKRALSEEGKEHMDDVIRSVQQGVARARELLGADGVCASRTGGCRSDLAGLSGEEDEVLPVAAGAPPAVRRCVLDATLDR